MTDEAKRQRNRERNEWRNMLVKHHLCRNCGKEDAYTMAGRSYCGDCAEYFREYHRQHFRQYRERQYVYVREKRQRAIDSHLCTVCFKVLPEGYDKRMCPVCANKNRKKHREAYHQQHEGSAQRGADGRCWKCNKEMAIPGKRLCKKCYDEMLPISLANIAKANERRKRECLT